MKKNTALSILLTLVLLLSVGGCANDTTGEQAQEPTQDATQPIAFPERPIELIVAFSAGGGTDVGARLLMPLVSDQLGETINVVNITGAAGWVGWTQLSQRAADGHHIGYINTPPFITGYLNPAMGRPAGLEMFTPIANHVWDVTVWAVHPDFEHQTLEELLAYVKDNPGQVSLATTGVYTQHHINALIMAQRGYDFTVIHTEGAADATTMTLGRHVDILSAGVGEVRTLIDDGELVPLAVLDSQRSKFIDVPTFEEASGYELISFSSRGIAAPAGVPDEIIWMLADALEVAINDPDHQARMEELGLVVKFMPPDEYRAFLENYERELKELLGW